jgi:hypothetical protein
MGDAGIVAQNNVFSRRQAHFGQKTSSHQLVVDGCLEGMMLYQP